MARKAESIRTSKKARIGKSAKKRIAETVKGERFLLKALEEQYSKKAISKNQVLLNIEQALAREHDLLKRLNNQQSQDTEIMERILESQKVIALLRNAHRRIMGGRKISSPEKKSRKEKKGK